MPAKAHANFLPSRLLLIRRINTCSAFSSIITAASLPLQAHSRSLPAVHLRRFREREESPRTVGHSSLSATSRSLIGVWFVRLLYRYQTFSDARHIVRPSTLNLIVLSLNYSPSAVCLDFKRDSVPDDAVRWMYTLASFPAGIACRLVSPITLPAEA